MDPRVHAVAAIIVATVAFGLALAALSAAIVALAR